MCIFLSFQSLNMMLVLDMQSSLVLYTGTVKVKFTLDSHFKSEVLEIWNKRILNPIHNDKLGHICVFDFAKKETIFSY